MLEVAREQQEGAKQPEESTVIVMLACATARFWNKRMSMSGCSVRYHECATNAAINARPVIAGINTCRSAIVPRAGLDDTPNRKVARPGDSNKRPM